MRITFDDGQFIAKCSFEERKSLQKAGWTWDDAIKRWVTTEPAAVERFASSCEGTAQEIISVFLEERNNVIGLSRALGTDFVGLVPDGKELYGFQNAGVEYALGRRDTLIADDPGLGKTNQAISFGNELFDAGELEDALILCEASQKAHWPRMWRDWTTTDLDIGVIQRKPRQKNGVKRTVSIIPDTAAVVVNYDILGKVHDWLTEQEWSLVIADECQALRNMEAERTRLVFGDVQRTVTLPNGRGGFFRKQYEAVAPIRAARRVFLTGTPIENRVHDLWPIVRAFDPDGLGSDYEYFIKRYCGAFWTDYGWNTSGSSNLIELQRYLRSSFMVRRTTAQALPDMPPKSRRPIFIPADNFKSILKKEDDVLGRNLDALEQHLAMERNGDETVEERMFSVWEELHNKFGAEVEDWSYEDIMENVPEEASVAFHEIAKFRSELALAKVPFIIDHVRQITDAGQKVVVFFYHTAVGQALKAAWGDSCGYIDGSVKAEKRQEEVDRFQEDEDCVAIFGQLHAASKGFTMTVANRAVFGELDWRPGTMKQAENRIWRISQENHCLIDHMIIESSIEVRQSQSLIEKQAAMDAALDDEGDIEYLPLAH
jgi:SNF2 family DNA or RNA helicase